MAEQQAKHEPQMSYPTREIIVTGERVATMVHTTILVSRLEQRMLSLSMSGAAEARNVVRRNSQRFMDALNAFEVEMRAIQNEVEQAGRRTGQRRTNRQAEAKPVLSRNSGSQSSDAAAPKAQAPKAQQGQQKQSNPGAQHRPAREAAQAQANNAAAVPAPETAVEAAASTPVAAPQPAVQASAVPADLQSL